MLVQIGKRSQGYQRSTSALLDETMAKTWANVRPMFAHVYVENRCHLKCDHCYEAEDTHPPEDALSVAEYSDIFDQLAQLGVLVLTLSGGEPFLRKDFLDIVELARAKRFAVRIYTSGTPITPEKADRIAALNVSEVHISLYSHDPEVHDKFTGTKGSWQKSVRALQLMQERGVHTVLKANVMTFNVDHLDELLALAEEHGADYALDPTVKPRMNGDTRPLRYAVAPAVLKDKVYKRPEFDKALSLTEADTLCNGENPRGDTGSLCAAARNLITVWADGQIAPCAMFPVAGGSVKDHSVEDIWSRSELFHRVRTTTFGDMNGCSSCDVRQGCSPCMAYALVEHDDEKACNSFSRQDATSKKLVADELLRVQKKFKKGVALPLVGEVDVDLKAMSDGRLFTEQG